MKNKTFSIETIGADNTNTEVVLEGQLTIRNAAAIQRDLLSILHSSQNLRLIVKNIIKLDLAILQIVLSLQKSAANLEKNLSLDLQLSDCASAVIQNSGLQNRIINSTAKN